MFRAKVLSYIGWLLISAWSRTVRTVLVNENIPEQLLAEGKNFIYAFWHGRQFLLFHHHRKSGVIIMASESRDGEIQAGILKRFGFNVVRGSSKRKGDRALLGVVEGLRAGRNVAFAVDGPRGPVYEVKQGVTYLAGKLGKVIVPVSSGARRRWILARIWDKYLLPMPFTKAVIVYEKPVQVQGTSNEELETKREELREALNRAMAEADSYFTDPKAR